MKNQILILLPFFLFTGCIHKEVAKLVGINSVTISPIPGAKQITDTGSNSQPQFSPLGDRLLFVSQERPSHKNPQVYEFDLKTNLERRITYQSGAVSHPLYLNDSEILYSSNTDELKENIEGIQSDHPERKAGELYLSDLFGTQINRLTYNKGYDDEAVILDKKNSTIIYVSASKDKVALAKMDLRSKKSSPYISSAGMLPSSPAISTDKTNIAWIENNLELKKQKVMLQTLKGKKIKTLFEVNGEIRDLQFFPEEKILIYSTRENIQSPFYLEAYDIEKNCKQTILKHTDSLVEPAVVQGHPSILAFSRLAQGKSQIYLYELSALTPPINCSEAQNNQRPAP